MKTSARGSLIREAVMNLLATQEEIELVAACQNLDSLLEAVEAEQPDVVLTDIRMPPDGTDEGIRAAEYLRENWPEMGVVLLSEYSDPVYAVNLLEKGSARRAYLLKERVEDLEQLTGATREVAARGPVIDPLVVDALVNLAGATRDEAWAAGTAVAARTRLNPISTQVTAATETSSSRYMAGSASTTTDESARTSPTAAPSAMRAARGLPACIGVRSFAPTAPG